MEVFFVFFIRLSLLYSLPLLFYSPSRHRVDRFPAYSLYQTADTLRHVLLARPLETLSLSFLSSFFSFSSALPSASRCAALLPAVKERRHWAVCNASSVCCCCCCCSRMLPCRVALSFPRLLPPLSLSRARPLRLSVALARAVSAPPHLRPMPMESVLTPARTRPPSPSLARPDPPTHTPACRRIRTQDPEGCFPYKCNAITMDLGHVMYSNITESSYFREDCAYVGGRCCAAMDGRGGSEAGWRRCAAEPATPSPPPAAR